MDHEVKLNKYLLALAQTSFFIFLGLVASKVLSYVYRIVIARYYSPEVYGLFTLTVIIATLVITLANLGFSEGLVRNISFYRGKREPKTAAYLARYILFTNFITSIILGAILYFISKDLAFLLNDPALEYYLKLASISIPASTLGINLLSLLRAYEQVRWFSFLFNVVQNVLRIGLLLALIALGFVSDAVILSYVLGSILLLACCYVVCRHKIKELFMKDTISPQKKKFVTRELLTYSLPLMLFNLIYVIFYWIDSLSIGYFKGIREVGLYNAAVPLALLLTFASEMFLQLFSPLINKEYSQKNISLIKEMSKQVGKWILVINLPVFLGLLVFAPQVLLFLFGQEFVSASTALRILSFSALITSLFAVSTQALSMLGKSRTILVDVIIACIANILLNALLIPLDLSYLGFNNADGLAGAALATVISMVLLNAFFFFQAKKAAQVVPIRRKMIRVLLSSIVFLAIIKTLALFNPTDNILLVVTYGVLGLAGYVIALVLTKAFDRHDIKIIKGFLAKKTLVRK